MTAQTVCANMPPSKPMPGHHYYFRSSSDSRDRSRRRDDSRDRSIMPGEGRPISWTTRIEQLEANYRHLEVCREGLQAELEATKQIVRILIGARRRDMNWFNANAGGAPISPSNPNYWHETEAIAAIFAFVQRSEDWRGAWDTT